MKRLLQCLILLSLIVTAFWLPAFAQVIGGNASLTVGTTSSSIPLPSTNRANFLFVLIAPAPGSTQEVFYQLGAAGVTATLSSPALPSGGICVNIGNQTTTTTLAAITSTGTATIRITQMTNCPQFSQLGGGGVVPAGFAARVNAGIAPLYFNPEDFGAYGDATEFGGLPIIQSGSNRLQVGLPYDLWGAVTMANASQTATITFASSAVVPPINLAYNTDANVKWRAFIYGAGSSGGTLISFVSTNGINCSTTSCTITVDNASSTAVNSTAGAPTRIQLYPDMGNASQGSPYHLSYQRMTTANTTMTLGDGTPAALITRALQNHDLTGTTLNVSSVTLSDQAVFNATTGSGGSTQDVGIQLQLVTPGGTYTGTILAEGTSGSVAYVYPQIPAADTLSGTAAVLEFGPYLFSSADVGKSIEVAGAGTNPSTSWTGTSPLLTTVASYIDPFNLTLTANAGASEPVSSSIPIPGSRFKIGHDDTLAYAEACEAASPGTERGTRYVNAQNGYFLASAASGSYLRALNVCLSMGEGRVFYPAGLFINHGPTPLGLDRPKALPRVAGFDPKVAAYQCNAQPTTCTVTFVGNSQFAQFTNGPSEADNWAVKTCDLMQKQLAPKNVVCNYMAVGGSRALDLDLAGDTGGIPSQAANYQWYVSAGTTKPWLQIVRDGVSAGSAGILMTGCPDLIIAEYTNVDGLNFSYGGLLDAINYTQGVGPYSTQWGSVCSTHPGWLLALDGNQPIFDPGGSTSYYQWSGDYVSQAIRGATEGGALPLADGGRVGLMADLNAMAHIVVDGFDPRSRPMQIASYTANYNGANPVLPVSWGVAVEDFGQNQWWRWSPSTGTCTVLAATSLANNIANANCFWGLLNNEIDLTIGNPNGGQTNGSPYWANMALIDYPGNFLRLFYCGTGGGCAAGSVNGMMDYEIDAWMFNTGANCSGTSGQAKITCTNPAVNFKHLASQVKVCTTTATNGTCPTPGTQIPVGATIICTGTVTAGTCAPDTTGKTITLSQNITTTFTNAALNIFLPQIPRTSTGQYGFACPGQTNTANNFGQINPMIEARGDSLVVVLCSGQAGPTLVQVPGVIRWGGPFQPTLSSPAGSPNTFKIWWNSNANIAQSESMESAPWKPDLPASYTIKDLYGWCAPNGLASSATPQAPRTGQCANHRGTLGSKIEDAVMSQINFSLGATIQTSERGYARSTAATNAGSDTVPVNVNAEHLTGTGGISTYAVTLPSAFAVNSDLVIDTTQTITTLTINTGSASQTINGGTAGTAATLSSFAGRHTCRSGTTTPINWSCF